MMSSSQSMEEGASGMRLPLKLLASSATRASGVELSGGREDSMTEASSHTHLRPPNRGHVTHTPITVIQKGHAPAGGGGGGIACFWCAWLKSSNKAARPE